MPLPGYSPDLMPVEALWRWLREDVTYNHCHATADDLTRRVAAFETRVNQDTCTIASAMQDAGMSEPASINPICLWATVLPLVLLNPPR